MSSLQLSRPNNSSFIRFFRGVNWVIVLWLLASVVPFLLFTRQLLTSSLADTPYAYLLWVPVFSFLWAIWSLRRVASYFDDPELNVLVSLPLLILLAVLLIHGFSEKWRYFFLGHELGLLIWPIWALCMGWLLFGVGVTSRLWKPMIYLFLAWPPLYSYSVNITTPVLQALANQSVHILATPVDWVRAGVSQGTYLIRHGSHVTPVYISSACSGADSFIAMVILIPVVLVTLKGSRLVKLYAILAGAVLAIFANILRLILIMVALHYVGPAFALNVLHPVLGIVLFAGLWWSVMRIGRWLGLESDIPKRTTSLKSAGYTRMSLSAILGLSLTGVLWYFQPQKGSVVHPVQVSTSSLEAMMPAFRGWSRHMLGTFNEASILGNGASTAAATYSTAQGDYALTEFWWSYNPLILQGYGVRDCLLFHGYKVLGSSSMQLAKDISATSYVAVLPPAPHSHARQVFVDTTYEIDVKHNGRNALMRIETATPITQIRSPGDEKTLRTIAEQLPKLMQAPYPTSDSLTGLNHNQAAHLYNYYMFIRQVAGTLLGPASIVGQPTPATSST